MTADDAPRFHALVTRPEVAPMLYLFHPGWTLAEAEVFLQDWAWRGRLGFRLSIEEAGQWVAGSASPTIRSPRSSTPFAPRPRAAALRARRWRPSAIFSPTASPRRRWSRGCFLDNPASMKVLRACGFAESHVELHASRGRPGPSPCQMFRRSLP